MKTFFTILTLFLLIRGNAQIEGDYYMVGYEINDVFYPTPDNEEIPFVVTNFGMDEDQQGQQYDFKETTICNMRRFKVDYSIPGQIGIIEAVAGSNQTCTISENQDFQEVYFDLFPPNSVFDVGYVDFWEEEISGILLSRVNENGDNITVHYYSDLIPNEPINPIQNLEWTQWYESPENYFIMSWEEPAQPHAELIGYNIYRNEELYRFQTETYLRRIPENMGTSNAEVDFLVYPEEMPDGFDAHVTAVYVGGMESDYTQTVFVQGAALGIEEIEHKAIEIYPNPATDILNFSEKLKEISIYDLSGKLIKTQKDFTEKLNVNELPKATYILKGTDDSGKKLNLKFIKN